MTAHVPAIPLLRRVLALPRVLRRERPEPPDLVRVVPLVVLTQLECRFALEDGEVVGPILPVEVHFHDGDLELLFANEFDRLGKVVSWEMRISGRQIQRPMTQVVDKGDLSVVSYHLGFDPFAITEDPPKED